MLLYRLQSHSNFYLHLIVFSLKYLIFGKYLSSHALGVNALLHWIFPGWYSLFVCRMYESIHPYYFLISWDSLVRFLLRRDGLVTWCFIAKVSLIRGILTEISVNILEIFWRCLCSWSRQWVWTNTIQSPTRWTIQSTTPLQLSAIGLQNLRYIQPTVSNRFVLTNNNNNNKAFI